MKLEDKIEDLEYQDITLVLRPSWEGYPLTTTNYLYDETQDKNQDEVNALIIVALEELREQTKDNNTIPYFRINENNKLQYKLGEDGSWIDLMSGDNSYMSPYFYVRENSNGTITLVWNKDGNDRVKSDLFTFNPNVKISDVVTEDEFAVIQANSNDYTAGTIYMVGDSAPYTMYIKDRKGEWVANGEFTSLTVDVTDTLGDSSNMVVSQAGVTSAVNAINEQIDAITELFVSVNSQFETITGDIAEVSTQLEQVVQDQQTVNASIPKLVRLTTNTPPDNADPNTLYYTIEQSTE